MFKMVGLEAGEPPAPDSTFELLDSMLLQSVLAEENELLFD